MTNLEICFKLDMNISYNVRSIYFNILMLLPLVNKFFMGVIITTFIELKSKSVVVFKEIK